MSTTIFRDTDENGAVDIIVSGNTWSDQAEAFFRFLLAQGFIVTEKKLADYFYERAEELGDLRSNTKSTPVSYYGDYREDK